MTKNYENEIEKTGLLLDAVQKKQVCADTDKMKFDLLQMRAGMFKKQIHEYLVPNGDEDGVLAIIRNIVKTDYPICKEIIGRLTQKYNTCFGQAKMACGEWLNQFLNLFEDFECLVAFRNLETFSLLWERDIPAARKVFANSIDPYNDNKYTGVTSPFAYYFTQMVVKKSLRFISKQYPVGYGKSIGDAIAIAWLLGVDPENDVLKVVGNPSLVTNNTKTIVDIMQKPFFGKVFPTFAKYFAEGANPMDMYSVCRIREGVITLTDSTRPTNVRVISKDTSVDGIRAKFLFLDDICRSKDILNLKQHQLDIEMYWNQWSTRAYDENDFYIVAGGTAYNVNDILSVLIRHYSGGVMVRSNLFKYAYKNQTGDCVFIKIPAIDMDSYRSTYPARFTLKHFESKRSIDDKTFEAMYQQNPQNPETTPLAYDKLQTYTDLPDGLSDYSLALLDPARSGKNYVALGIHRVKTEETAYGTKIEKHYLVDCIFELTIMQDVYDKIVQKVLDHHIIKLAIENNTDTSLGNLLREKLAKAGADFCEVEEFYSTQNKEEKLREVVYSNESYFKRVMVYPAYGVFAPSSAMGKFMMYLTSYDYTQKLEYDDSIDEECMYIKRFVETKKETKKVQIIRI